MEKDIKLFDENGEYVGTLKEIYDLFLEQMIESINEQHASFMASKFNLGKLDLCPSYSRYKKGCKKCDLNKYCNCLNKEG